MNSPVENKGRKAIHDLEEAMLNMPDQYQLDLEVKHHFSKDIYGRELSIPAGSIIVGKIHKHSSLNILAEGEMVLVTEDGVRNLKAPYVVASKPGVKRAAYAKTNCTWVTVHGTDETDLEVIEDKFIAKDYSEVEGVYSTLLEHLKEKE